MDHLPVPKEPIYPILEVVCLCRIDPESTFGSFADFPSSRGFDKDQILLGEFPGKTDEEVASFLQEWLFFTLLTEVFGICELSIRCTEFVRRNKDGTTLITTAPLNGYIKAWAEHESRVTQDEASVHLKEVDTCLEEASLMIGDHHRSTPPLDPSHYQYSHYVNLCGMHAISSIDSQEACGGASTTFQEFACEKTAGVPTKCSCSNPF
jgi:hypothetical protein